MAQVHFTCAANLGGRLLHHPGFQQGWHSGPGRRRPHTSWKWRRDIHPGADTTLRPERYGRLQRGRNTRLGLRKFNTTSNGTVRSGPDGSKQWDLTEELPSRFQWDGRLDLAITNPDNNSVSILLQTPVRPGATVTIASSQILF